MERERSANKAAYGLPVRDETSASFTDLSGIGDHLRVPQGRGDEGWGLSSGSVGPLPSFVPGEGMAEVPAVPSVWGSGNRGGLCPALSSDSRDQNAGGGPGGGAYVAMGPGEGDGAEVATAVA
jgi:hypothetical protein